MIFIHASMFLILMVGIAEKKHGKLLKKNHELMEELEKIWRVNVKLVILVNGDLVTVTPLLLFIFQISSITTDPCLKLYDTDTHLFD